MRSIAFLKSLVILVLLCGDFVYAKFDMSIHGGLKRFDGSSVSAPSLGGSRANWENHVWILGTDVIYRLPANIGIGLRYQHLISSGQYTPIRESEESETQEESRDSYLLQTFHSNTNRIALLGSYKFINSTKAGGFFAGVLVAVDIFKTLNFDMPKTDESSSLDKTMSNQSWLWEKLSGQAGLEMGFKWTYMFVKVEVGYSLLSFDNLECKSQTNECRTHSSEDFFSFNAFYGVLGVGFAFK